MGDNRNFFSSFTCLKTNPDSHCITYFLYLIADIIIIVLACFILIKVYLRTGKFFSSRKQLLIFNLLLSAITYLLYNWTRKITVLYFPDFYFYNVYFIYLLYYFGRKSILLVSFNQYLLQQNVISPLFRLKMISFFSIWMFCCFTIILAFNLFYYYDEPYTVRLQYSLCKAKFFNTTRTLSFLLESIFLFLGISIIKYLKEKQPSEKGDLSKSFLSHYSRVETRFQNLKFLVFLNFFGSLISFLMNIYFQIRLQTSEKTNGDYNCQLFTLNQFVLNSILNTVFGILIKIVTYFWPFFLTLKLFWPQEKKQQYYEEEEDIQEYQLYRLKSEDKVIDRESQNDKD